MKKAVVYRLRLFLCPKVLYICYMKFLKRWSLFLEADELGADGINPTSGVDELIDKNDKMSGVVDGSIQKILTEYRSKKIALETIFKTMEKDEASYASSGGTAGKIWDDKYLDDQLTLKVYSNKRETSTFLRNPYLKNYESVYKLKRIFDRIDVALEKDKRSLSRLKEQNNTQKESLASTSNIAVQNSIKVQIEQNNAKISELNKTISSNEKERILAKDNFETKLSNFKKLMIEEEKKLKT